MSHHHYRTEGHLWFGVTPGSMPETQPLDCALLLENIVRRAHALQHVSFQVQKVFKILCESHFADSWRTILRWSPVKALKNATHALAIRKH